VGYALLGFVGLAVVAAGMLTLSAVARWLVARALGVRGVRFPFGVNRGWSWTTASRVPNVLCSVGTVVVLYLVSAVLIAAGMVAGGIEMTDETSMRVQVTEGGPASNAGLLDGDRIDAVNGVPVRTWSALRSAVAAHPSEPIVLSITRGESSLEVRVTPDAHGSIRILVPTTHVSVSGVTAVRKGVTSPGLALYGTCAGIARELVGSDKQVVSGPIAIVRETSKRPHDRAWGSVPLFLGLLVTYTMPLFVLIGAFLTPGRRPKHARRARHPPSGMTQS
jgi:membrane-associated protease RseP (regulator of RpoE activity)